VLHKLPLSSGQMLVPAQVELNRGNQVSRLAIRRGAPVEILERLQPSPRPAFLARTSGASLLYLGSNERHFLGPRFRPSSLHACC
jgi:hypothetical protein